MLVPDDKLSDGIGIVQPCTPAETTLGHIRIGSVARRTRFGSDSHARILQLRTRQLREVQLGRTS
jgi:hypothetical protein